MSATDTDARGSGLGRSVLEAMGDALGVPAEDDLDLSDGEWLLEAIRCNRTQNRRRAVGGRLFVTTERLAFRPHTFDDGLAGRAVTLDLDDVDRVTTEPSRRSLRRFLAAPLDALFGGGLRPRLRVETADRAELFVVSDPTATAERIESARRS